MDTQITNEIKKVANQLEKLGKYKSADKMDLIYKRIVAQNEPVQNASFAEGISEAVKDNMTPGNQSAGNQMAVGQTGADGSMPSEIKDKLTAVLQDIYGKALMVESLLFEAKKHNIMNEGVLKEVESIGSKLRSGVSSVIKSINGGEEKPEKKNKSKEDIPMTDEAAMGELGKVQ